MIGNFPDFFQMTPKNIAEARSLSYPEAFKLDRTLGYQKNFPGGVGRVKYIGEGLKSLAGFGNKNIGGATPLTRKLALDAANLIKSGVGFATKRAIPILGLFSSTPLGADSEITDEERQSIERQSASFRGLSDPEVYGELDEEKNLLQRILEFAPLIGEKSLSGILMRSLGKTRSGLAGLRDEIGTRLGPERFGTSQAAFDALTPSQQRYVGSIYGQGGIMQGYNPVSFFGRGPAGAIQNRIDRILGRKAPQTKDSIALVKKLQADLDQLGGSDSGDYGPSGYEGMSDAQSAQERSEGGRGSRR